VAKYLMLKHYRGAPAAVNDVPMDQWAPEEIDEIEAHALDFAHRLQDSGEYVDSQALAPQGEWIIDERPPLFSSLDGDTDA